jgi:hypothetical protein
MPLATFTGVTEAAHYVRQEQISPFLAGYNYPPPVLVAIAAMKQGKGTVPLRFPRLGAISVPSGTLAETVDAVDVNVSTAENSLTPARVAFAMPISDYLDMNQEGVAIPEAVMIDIIRACWGRIDLDTGLGVQSSTVTYGAATDPFTLSHLRGLKAAWRALNVMDSELGVALAVHGDGLSALEESAETAGSPWALKETPEFQLVHGYQGKLRNVELFSDNQIAAESTGHSNIMTPLGDGAGIGIAMTKEPTITLHRGNDGLRRAVVYAHVEMYFGTGIVNQTRMIEAFSD